MTNPPKTVTELLKDYRSSIADLIEQVYDIGKENAVVRLYALDLEFAKQIRQYYMSRIPPEIGARLGSENQEVYVAYQNGYNKHRTETIAAFEREA